MTEKTMDKLEDTLIWILISVVAVLMLFAMVHVAKLVFFPTKEEIHTETMYVEDHKYTIFYDADNKIKHIEHSPECDCFTIEYD